MADFFLSGTQMCREVLGFIRSHREGLPALQGGRGERVAGGWVLTGTRGWRGPPLTCVSSADIPARYPFQALPPHYGRPYPFLLQPTAAADADGLAPDVPLPADGPERLALSPEDKPLRLSPSKVPEPLREIPDEEPLVEREVKAEVEDMDEEPAQLASLGSPLTLPPEDALAAPSPAGGLLEAQALSAGGQGPEEPPGCPDFAEGAEGVDSPGRTESCAAAPDLGPRLTPEPLVEAKEEPVEVPVDVPVAVPLAEAVPGEEDLAQAAPVEPQPSLELPDCDMPVGEGECPSLEAPEAGPVPGGACFLEEAGSEEFLPSLEDPLAGMNALAAAAELPQARPLPSPGTGAPALETLEAAQSLVLEQSFLHGITLLSEIAELELEKRSQEAAGEAPGGCFSPLGLFFVIYFWLRIGEP